MDASELQRFCLGHSAPSCHPERSEGSGGRKAASPLRSWLRDLSPPRSFAALRMTRRTQSPVCQSFVRWRRLSRHPLRHLLRLTWSDCALLGALSEPPRPASVPRRPCCARAPRADPCPFLTSAATAPDSGRHPPVSMFPRSRMLPGWPVSRSSKPGKERLLAVGQWLPPTNSDFRSTLARPCSTSSATFGGCSRPQRVVFRLLG